MYAKCNVCGKTLTAVDELQGFELGLCADCQAQTHTIRTSDNTKTYQKYCPYCGKKM